MAPIVNIAEKDFERASKLLELAGITYTISESGKSKEERDFVYVPSINLYVAKEKKLHGENWFNSNRKLQANRERMLNVPEFVEFLKYSKDNFPEVYEEITGLRNPVRAEWLDADFKMKNRELYVNSNHILEEDGKLNPGNSKMLDKSTLMKDKIPGISLEDWIASPTKQGLPHKNVALGSLFYWFPRGDNNSVAWFGAGSGWVGLVCYKHPFNRNDYVGVRAAKKQEEEF